MATTIDIVMFVVPLLMAILFSFLALTSNGRGKSSDIFNGVLITFMSSLIAAISWIIFGLTWPALATTEMFATVAYLWYAIGVIFIVISFVSGLRMLDAAFKNEKPRLKLKMNDEDDD